MSLELALHLRENYESPGDDWIYLGRGVSRAAWLGPDGNVYKVGLADCNRSEAKAAAWFKNKFGPTPGIFIPDFIHYEETVSGMKSVIQTVYLPADSEQDYNSSMRRIFLRRLVRCGLTDSHGENVYSWRGLLTCVDWGYTDFFYGDSPQDSE